MGPGGGAGFSSMDEALRTFMGAFGGGGGGGGGGIFDSFFGFESQGGGGRRPGASKKISLTLTLEEALQGVEKEVNLTNLATCSACHGKGAKSDADIKTCPTCSGSGQVHETRGFFSMSSVCPDCQGTGKIITNPCPVCHGQGLVRKKQRVKIKVPAGVDDDTRLRMGGYGDAGEHGGPNGDLYVFVHVKQHDVFTREGDDLIVDLPVSLSEAALGVKKEIPSLLGKSCRIQITEGTQSGKLLRVRHQGAPSIHTGVKGDLIIRVHVETPTHLSAKQKEILQQFQSTETEKNFPKRGSFMDRIKGFFSHLSS